MIHTYKDMKIFFYANQNLKKARFEKNQGNSRLFLKQPVFIGFFQIFGFFAHPAHNKSIFCQVRPCFAVVMRDERVLDA